MLLVSGTAYRGDSQVSGNKQEVLCQTILSGGTADFYIKDVDSAAWSLVEALTDVPVAISISQDGFYKVETTGAAVVYADWS
jgi:hypothetical protein